MKPYIVVMNDRKKFNTGSMRIAQLKSPFEPWGLLPARCTNVQKKLFYPQRALAFFHWTQSLLRKLQK